jgi:acyl carrier protein
MTSRPDLEQLVSQVVCQRLQLESVPPEEDLRSLRAFSSFAAVDILERLEDALAVEIAATELSAERLCSVQALTELFLHADPEEAIAS